MPDQRWAGTSLSSYRGMHHLAGVGTGGRGAEVGQRRIHRNRLSYQLNAEQGGGAERRAENFPKSQEPECRGGPGGYPPKEGGQDPLPGHKAQGRSLGPFWVGGPH